MTGFEWIGTVAESIIRFFPHCCVIDTRNDAVRWRTLRMRDLLRFKWDPTVKTDRTGQGFIVWWPLVTTLEEHACAYQTIPMVAQDIVTSDDKTVTARGMLAFEITDVLKIYPTSYDSDDTIKDLAATAFHDVICRMSWEDLKKGQGRTLDTQLRNAAKKDLEVRGILVHKLTLTSLTQSRVYRVVQSTSQEGEQK